MKRRNHNENSAGECRNIIYNLRMENISNRTRNSEIVLYMYVHVCIYVYLFFSQVTMIIGEIEFISSQEMKIKLTVRYHLISIILEKNVKSITPIADRKPEK